MSKLNWYQKTAIITLAAVVFLIFVGGLVRISGAGLGCPDWPKCWGCWVPPADASGINATQYDVSQFNKTKMWIEYLNRIVGVVIGLLIMATFALSFRYRKTQPVIFWGSLASFILVLFQGWLGGQVVKSGLHTGMVTIHMIVAIVLLSLLLYTTFRARTSTTHAMVSERGLGVILLSSIALYLITVAQVVLGSQVREAIELVARSSEDLARNEWVSITGIIFVVHRSFSWLVLIASALLVRWKFRFRVTGVTGNLIWLNIGLVVTQIVSGVLMENFAIPPVCQVLHLGISSLLICTQFLLILFTKAARPKTKLELEVSPAEAA